MQAAFYCHTSEPGDGPVPDIDSGCRVYLDCQWRLLTPAAGKEPAKATLLDDSFSRQAPIAVTLERGVLSPAFEEVLQQMRPNSTVHFMTTLSVNLPAHEARGIGGVIPPHAKFHYILRLRGYTHPTNSALSREPTGTTLFASEFPVDKGIMAHQRLVTLFQLMHRDAGRDNEWPLQDTIILLTSGMFSYKYYRWMESATSNLMQWNPRATGEVIRRTLGGAGAGASNSSRSGARAAGSSSGGSGSAGSSSGAGDSNDAGSSSGAGSSHGAGSSRGAGAASLPNGSSVALMAASTVPSVTTVFAAKGAFLAAWEEVMKPLYGSGKERSHEVGLSFNEWQRAQQLQA